MVNFKSIAFLFSLGLSSVTAQEQLFAEPTEYWTNQVLPLDGSDGGVSKGNGVKLSPDGRHLIVTSLGGTVTSFSAGSGAFEWEYQPPLPDAGIIRSHSQVVFTTDNAVTPPYMVYSVVENGNSLDAATRVIALDPEGNELWVSDPLDGISRGDPVVSDDGSYIFLTHNSNFESIGSFTALFAPGDGAVFYSQSNETTPFAPLGIYHSPIEGNYDGLEGRGNTNDMIMWTMTPKPTDTAVNPGHTFGFQFPIGFDGNNSEVGYFLLGDQPRAFQGTTAPTLANSGLNAYFAASRSNYFGWTGNTINGRGRFNLGPDGFINFERNAIFPGESCFASPAVGGPADAPVIFGGTAAPQFARMVSDLSTHIVVATTAFIKSEARVDPFDRVVYYVEENGLIHQANFDTLADLWTVDIASPVEGEMALDKNGLVLYVADTAGFIRAYQLSEIPVTSSPTGAPTAQTAVPTGAPTALDTPEATDGSSSDMPVAAPTEDGATSGPGDMVMPSASPGESPTTPAPTGDSAGGEPAPADGAAQPMMLLSVAALAFCLLF